MEKDRADCYCELDFQQNWFWQKQLWKNICWEIEIYNPYGTFVILDN